MEESAPPRPWQDIPLELAGLVIGRLPAHADRVRFAAVCTQWRAAAREVRPLPPPLPLLALPDVGTVYSPPLRQPFRLPAAAAGFAAACGSWLLFSSADGGCFLRNPFSNATVPLPALHRVRERYKSSGAQPIFTYETTGSTKLSVRRLLLCSPRLVAAYVVLGSCWDDDCTRVPYMAVCQPGAGSWWSVCMDDSLVSEGPVVPTLAAMAFHKGMLFAVERYRGRFYAVNIGVDQSTGDPWVSRFRRIIPGNIPTSSDPSTIIPHDNGIMETLFYQVESCGVLLVVCRQRQFQYQWGQLGKQLLPTGWKEFEVFQADFQESRWTKLATIGDDQVLFLSKEYCASLCVLQLGMPGDHILFFENVDEDRSSSWYEERISSFSAYDKRVFFDNVDEDRSSSWYEEESIGSCSVYDMRDCKISALLPSPLHSKHGTVRATWLFQEEPSEEAATR
ncbi:unnamed protein product [Urochloa decumbens]|uniref:KIB1-4 beta-propeller domain-containing protein n=1 Tax=Urochloa decumbens TaxID=240449 RepID=A0ABC9AXL3_9POAL